MIECGNLAIADAAMKCEAVFASHERAHVGISGGADSDVMIDLCERVRQVQPMDITYDFSDTGIEYAATKEHLDYLEDRYGVKIDRTRATKSIPLCCHSYGQPFVSKMVAHHLHILQRHGFEWDDMPLALLKAKYPDAPVSTLRWWSNDYVGKTGIMTSYTSPLPLGRGTVAIYNGLLYNEYMRNKRKQNVVYSCKYHVVWCPKYRRPVLVDGVDERLREICHEVANELSFEIIEMEVVPDHVHMLLDVDPQLGIHKAVKRMKGRSSHDLRQEFPWLRSRIPTLWTNSYFVSTVGGAPLEAVKEYIENQRNV